MWNFASIREIKGYGVGGGWNASSLILLEGMYSTLLKWWIVYRRMVFMQVITHIDWYRCI
jgi:hypothetical protein